MPDKGISFARLVQFLLEQHRNGFYGTVHIQFRGAAGGIGSVKAEQTWVNDQELPVKDTKAVELMRTGRYQIPA